MGKPTLKIDRYLSLGDVGFLLSFRVVSGDYGKPWSWKPAGWWFQFIVFLFSPRILGGRWPNLTCAYFSNGWEKTTLSAWKGEYFPTIWRFHLGIFLNPSESARLMVSNLRIFEHRFFQVKQQQESIPKNKCMMKIRNHDGINCFRSGDWKIVC